MASAAHKPKSWLAHLGDATFIGLGVLSAGLGLKGFLLSSHFIDGGVVGISMLLSKLSGMRLAWLIPLVNLPFIGLGYTLMDRGFVLKSVAAILSLALCIALVPYPDITPDKLLTAVFGGFFIGAGIGLTIRGGAVMDGTEMAALIISRSCHFLRVGDVILLLNIVIFATATFILGVEPALYSILTYMAASKTVNFLIHGIEEYTAVTIMSQQSNAIRARIISDLNRSVTIYKGEGGLSGADQNILFCVLTKLEVGSVKELVRDIDPSAFVVTHALADAEGGVVKKPVLH